MKQILMLTETGYEVIGVNWASMSGKEVLESLYELIGCERIETVSLSESVVLIVDEEGLFNSSFHRYVQYGELETMAHGNIIIASVKDDNLSGFTENEMDDLLNNLKTSNPISEWIVTTEQKPLTRVSLFNSEKPLTIQSKCVNIKV